MKKKLIIITTGGTGGHIFPAESFASEMLKTDYSLAFITDKRGKKMTGTLSSLPTYYVSSESVTGKAFFQKAVAAFKLLFGFIQSLILLVRLRPVLVIGFGGYASIPATLAAQFLHIPVALHEQNAILGRANRLLARRTVLIATSFTPTQRIPDGSHIVQTGMPVRPQIAQKAQTPYPTDTSTFNLLIFGGSQGAKAFSDLVPKAVNMLSPQLKAKLSITQQVRAEDMEKVKEEYRNSGIKHIQLSPFFDNMPDLIAQSHLIISRSGSSSLIEFSTIGRPALLIPLPTAADDHQTANAKIWTADGSGWLMVEKAITPEILSARIAELIENPEVLQTAARHIINKPIQNAGLLLAEEITNLLKEKK